MLLYSTQLKLKRGPKAHRTKQPAGVSRRALSETLRLQRQAGTAGGAVCSFCKIVPWW